jgi:histidinol-phosphatase
VNDSAAPTLYDADLAVALELADAADEISMARFRALDLVVDSKPDLTPVSDADTAVERVLRMLIARAHPSDAVHGEEFGGAVPHAGRTWVLDPIDGTKNFVRALPVWATLIALVDDGVPVVGVVSAPALARRWWASSGGGAWAASLVEAPRRLAVSSVDRLEDASISYSSLGGWAERRTAFESLLDRAWRTRAYGDFWSHMLVAEGAVDVAAEPELALWDVAALIPIVREAGGVVSGVDGSPVPGTAGAVSSNGRLHAQTLQQLG